MLASRARTHGSFGEGGVEEAGGGGVMTSQRHLTLLDIRVSDYNYCSDVIVILYRNLSSLT